MVFKKISTFLAWAVFTFLSHFSAKQFLSSSEHHTENVILLTSLQMAAGSVLFLKLVISGSGEVEIYTEQTSDTTALLSTSGISDKTNCLYLIPYLWSVSLLPYL